MLTELTATEPYLPSYPWLLNPATSWPAGMARSRELTPVFIQRYVGRHRSPTMSFHTCCELTFVFRGAGLLRTEHGTVPFKAGHAYLIPPGLKHREDSATVMDTLWMGLTGTMLDGLEREPGLRSAEAPELQPIAELLWQSLRGGAFGPELDGFARTLAARFLRLASRDRRADSDDMARCLELMRRNSSRSFSVRALASKLGYSEGYFFRLFKRRTGLTPLEFLTRERMERAANLLRHSSTAIHRVARAVGYDDPLYFSRAFRRVTGLSPSEFRHQPH